VPDGDQRRLKRVLADALNSYLASRLRVEIVSADSTAATRLINLTELAHTVGSELRLIEQMPAEQLPHESTWDQDGLHIIWRARERTPGEVDAPVVVEPTA
jgi:molybdenum cofactor biosynthesis enzyme MoaA